MTRVQGTRAIVGICHMQVCAVADATDEEILAVCNAENRSGTELGWTTVHRSGRSAPVPCADDPTRLHIMVNC